jgi:hypothetical protein
MPWWGWAVVTAVLVLVALNVMRRAWMTAGWCRQCRGGVHAHIGSCPQLYGNCDCPKG